MVDVHGTVADGYEPVREAFLHNFQARGERGAAVALYRDGRKVVDLWAGLTDPEGTQEWAQDTAQVVRSATKGVAAACLLLLHQRGQLDLDAPVAAYWPEFKAHGKERVTVRDALAHRAAVPALDTPLTLEQALDGVSGPRALAAQTPWWEPGPSGGHGYHAMTYSWLLGELVLRATGRSIGRYVEQEIARPLGLDLWIGLPAEHAARVGRLAAVEPPPAPDGPSGHGLKARPKRAVTEAYADPASLTRRAFGAVRPLPDENDPAYRAAELPASAGIATARSLARFYAALVGEVSDEGLGGREACPADLSGVAALSQPGGREVPPGAGAGGVVVGQRRPPAWRPGGAPTASPAPSPKEIRRTGLKLFAPATLTAARTLESDGPDRVLIVNTRFGLGYMLHSPSSPFLAPGSFGHPGRGGSLAFADPESGIGFGYVTNGMQRNVTADPRAQALVRAVRKCFGPSGVGGGASQR